MAANEKCEVSSVRLTILVPDNLSIEDYRKHVMPVLLSPLKHIYQESNHTYSLQDEAGTRIQNVQLEITAKCTFKKEETRMGVDYFRLQGLPLNYSIDSIVLYKPSTNETYNIA